ncbi:hypothetical protein HMPREF0308_1897 [Corynebacterium striatum ATCC 6940]|nr:hypothetical protein HMPREF0308_1897 [Corynebacterium striatum ATCC 6940]
MLIVGGEHMLTDVPISRPCTQSRGERDTAHEVTYSYMRD